MITVKDVNFEVNIDKKHIKNIYMKLDGNCIKVSCPYRLNDYEVYRFIESKKNWLYKVYQYNLDRPKNMYMYDGSDVFYIFGKPYKLIRNIGKKRVNIENDTIFFTYKNENEDSIKALYKYFDSMLLNEARGYLDRHIGILHDYGYNNYPELNTRIMTSKWGVCYTRNNKINISSYLIHYPLECLEYIMVHEMTHFIIPNHSKRFYEIVNNNMPDYKIANEKLK